MFKGWELIYMWTMPDDDWLLGIEYAPDNVAIKHTEDEDEYGHYAIVSIGFLIVRIDILIPYNE